MLGTPYPGEDASEETIDSLLRGLRAAGCRMPVITGVTLDTDDGSSITNFVFDNGKIDLVTVHKLGSDRSGTGDAFFAVLAGSIINGENLVNAARKAANFVTRCIAYAEELNLPWNYGLPFEEFLLELSCD